MTHIENSDSNSLIEHKRRNLGQRRNAGNRLFLRNILNGIFMTLCLLAILGVIIAPAGSKMLNLSYMVGIIAILVKMIEVMLRMPGIKKNE